MKSASWCRRTGQMIVCDGLKRLIGCFNATAGKKKCSSLPVVGGEDQGGIITRADGGGEELLFVSQPDTGPLQHKGQKNTISIWTQGSYWRHPCEEGILDI